MKKFLIIIGICVFVVGCGYQPIYVNKQQDKYLFKNMELIGDKSINKKIVSSLNFTVDNDLIEENILILSSKKNIEETSKDSKGRVQSYKTIIEVNMVIKKGNKIINTKDFYADFSYNNKENNFDLANYQKGIENNLTTQIIQKILIYLSL